MFGPELADQMLVNASMPGGGGDAGKISEVLDEIHSARAEEILTGGTGSQVDAGKAPLINAVDEQISNSPVTPRDKIAGVHAENSGSVAQQRENAGVETGHTPTPVETSLPEPGMEGFEQLSAKVQAPTQQKVDSAKAEVQTDMAETQEKVTEGKDNTNKAFALGQIAAAEGGGVANTVVRAATSAVDLAQDAGQGVLSALETGTKAAAPILEAGTKEAATHLEAGTKAAAPVLEAGTKEAATHLEAGTKAISPDKDDVAP